MKKYKIVLKNKEDSKIEKSQEFKKLTFSEAVTVAYKWKAELGNDWEIVSVLKKGDL
jgi:hypothetical protein